MDKKDELWNLCKEFIKTQDIYCPEAVYQTDRVIDHAYAFIDDICQIVGFNKKEEGNGN